MLEEGLYARLKADITIKGYVGDNVFPLVQPHGSDGPCVIYARIGSLRSQTLCYTDKATRAIIDIDSYSKNYLTTKRIADAVRKSLVDFTGLMGDTRVKNVSLESELDLTDPEPGYYRVAQTFFIWYVET